jgi:osmotically inducible protein OsmC
MAAGHKQQRMLAGTTAARPGAILNGVQAPRTGPIALARLRSLDSARSSKEDPMAAVQRTAELDWTGSIARGSGVVSGRSGAISGLPVTVASRFGAPEGKTSPEELIAAAHATCFTMALGSILAAQRTPPEQLRVTATVTLETSGTPAIASSQLEAHGVVPGADAASFDRAAHEAEQTCPVSRALRGSVEIGVRATLDEPSVSSVSAPREA